MTQRDPIFGDFADEYERHRPDYPAALWTTLLEGARFHDAVDLGCGTGRATRELARRGLAVIGVEPEAGMREEARRAARAEGLEIDVREGAAEATGLPERCVDLVVAAQAFHWFDPGATRSEVCRLLRPEGTFAVWWNDRRVDGVPWMQEYEALIEEFNPAYRQGYREHDWPARLLEPGRLESLRFDEFAHARTVDVDDFVALAFTSSYIRNVLRPEQRDLFEEALRSVLRRAHGDASFEIPYRTRLYRVQTVA